MPLECREYGRSGGRVILLHGGPAAPGTLAPVARELAGTYHVMEPFQRGSGEAPLTVRQHVEDLADLARTAAGEQRPVLVGESWGAMLALAAAAAEPELAAGLVLIGCGTFDAGARAVLHETIEQRKTPELRAALLQAQSLPDAQRLPRLHELMAAIYDFDAPPEETPSSLPPFDARAHEETWHDMLRQQQEGAYPAAFARIRCPVVMLHGAYDPHPGRLIAEGLRRYLPQLAYHELEHCGHSPWRERQARGKFHELLRQSLDQMLLKTPSLGCAAPQ
jgi:pimeloyl-ACP methyl ester carboxylesterase